MSLLTYARDERVIVMGLAAAVVGVVATMRMFLTRLRDEAEIKQPQPTTQYITQETEDSLKPNTLDTLLAHYNFAIREIAGKIVTDRAVNDGESIDQLLWGITRPDYDERLKCLRSLAYITDPRMNPRAFGKWRRVMYEWDLSEIPWTCRISVGHSARDPLRHLPRSPFLVTVATNSTQIQYPNSIRPTPMPPSSVR